MCCPDSPEGPLPGQMPGRGPSSPCSWVAAGRRACPATRPPMPVWVGSSRSLAPNATLPFSAQRRCPCPERRAPVWPALGPGRTVPWPGTVRGTSGRAGQALGSPKTARMGLPWTFPNCPTGFYAPDRGPDWPSGPRPIAGQGTVLSPGPGQPSWGGRAGLACQRGDFTTILHHNLWRRPARCPGFGQSWKPCPALTRQK
jgi:hypothetical protein